MHFSNYGLPRYLRNCGELQQDLKDLVHHSIPPPLDETQDRRLEASLEATTRYSKTKEYMIIASTKSSYLGQKETMYAVVNRFA